LRVLILSFQGLEISHLKFSNTISFDIFKILLEIGKVIAQVYGNQFKQFAIGSFKDRLLSKLNTIDFNILYFRIGDVEDGDSSLKNKQIKSLLDMKGNLNFSRFD